MVSVLQGSGQGHKDAKRNHPCCLGAYSLDGRGQVDGNRESNPNTVLCWRALLHLSIQLALCRTRAGVKQDVRGAPKGVSAWAMVGDMEHVEGVSS